MYSPRLQFILPSLNSCLSVKQWNALHDKLERCRELIRKTREQFFNLEGEEEG